MVTKLKTIRKSQFMVAVARGRAYTEEAKLENKIKKKVLWQPIFETNQGGEAHKTFRQKTLIFYPHQTPPLRWLKEGQEGPRIEEVSHIPLDRIPLD